ncbi:putative transcription factor C2H2 family [Helianthus anomalus]
MYLCMFKVSVVFGVYLFSLGQAINISIKTGFILQLHVAPVAPPLQRRPTFTCSICLDCIVEETSTICGHIFCKVCIERALLTTDQCPMCRRKITHRGIHRIHFEDPL